MKKTRRSLSHILYKLLLCMEITLFRRHSSGAFVGSLMILTLLFCACVRKRPASKGQTVFWYDILRRNGNATSDTFYAGGIVRHDSADTLLAVQYFLFNGKDHRIRMYVNDLHAPTDGGRLGYELDSLGMIYMRSTTWHVANRLKSDDDSIDDLIDATLSEILMNSNLLTYRPESLFESKIRYNAPHVITGNR